MFKHFLIRGDCHGKFDWIETVFDKYPTYAPEETAIIILGDAGLNFYLNKTDDKTKRYVDSFDFTIYCLRGNHEQRPEFIPDMIMWPDDNIGGPIYLEKRFPNIRYLIDGNIYHFADYSALCIGGAYSIDKYYRLAINGLTGQEGIDYLARKAHWFAREQLSVSERKEILDNMRGKSVDFIFSHTCPASWAPVDLFLPSVDQSKVDSSMEIWLDEIKDAVDWKMWCFGHYHRDRMERPHVEQYFNDIADIKDIVNRWYGDETYKTEWWLVKSPQYYRKGDTPFDYCLRKE